MVQVHFASTGGLTAPSLPWQAQYVPQLKYYERLLHQHSLYIPRPAQKLAAFLRCMTILATLNPARFTTRHLIRIR
ncbi:hypothetical protein HmCmsJML100_01690 [Escherichia coli]|nr:hypothetical protein HmCmsJML100_01690 [Escherichia coli]